MGNSNEIMSIVKKNCGTITGFARVDNVLPEDLEHLTHAVTIGIRLSDEIINRIKEKPTKTYYHHYRQINILLDQITLKVSLFIQEQGFLSLPIPASQSINNEKYSGLFSHKMGGTLSGLGWIGKSALFITEEYGPRLRLGTVLTNMPLPQGKPITESKCGKCNLCVLNCPALAIKGEVWKVSKKREDLYDAMACSKFMKENYNMIGRGHVCGKCIEVCPQGTKTKRMKTDA